MRGNRKNKTCLEKISFYCEEIDSLLKKHDNDKTYYMQSSELQYACSMCIVQIGEMIALLDDEFIKDNPEIPWRQIKGARNVYVHDYGELDLEEVWNTLTENVPDLKIKVDKLIDSIRETQE